MLCYFYIIFIFILLHCPLSGPDLIYISLLIIPCIIYYVTNKETLDLDGLTPEVVKELRKATDKHTAQAIGRSMAGSVAAEHHLWLNPTEIREKDIFSSS